MSLRTDLLNGTVSLIISVAATVVAVDEDEGPWELSDLLLSVAVSAFLSGFFTSYFAD